MRRSFPFIVGLLFSLCGATLSGGSESTAERRTAPVTFPGFNWDRVPLNLHLGKRTVDLTDSEVVFNAGHSRFIVLEKGHGSRAHCSTEAGIADSARRITARNPDGRRFRGE